MDEEIKGLLTKLLDKLDGIEARIVKLEGESHKQITLEDYYNRYQQWPSIYQQYPSSAVPSYLNQQNWQNYSPFGQPIC